MTKGFQQVQEDEDANQMNLSLVPGQCAFCLRVMKAGTTEHHLIPRTCHKNRWFKARFSRETMRQTVSACRDCHKAIHRLIPSEKQLGKEFNTFELLLAQPDFFRFVEWVKRQK